MERIITTGLSKEIVMELNGSQLKVFNCLGLGILPEQSGLSMPTFKAAYDLLYAKGYISIPWKRYNLLLKLERGED